VDHATRLGNAHVAPIRRALARRDTLPAHMGMPFDTNAMACAATTEGQTLV
jgi:hypothetical protein